MHHVIQTPPPPPTPTFFFFFSTFLLICSVNMLTSKWTCYYYVSLIKSHLTGPGHWFNRSCTFSSSQNFKKWVSSQSHGWMKIRHTRWYRSWNCTNTWTTAPVQWSGWHIHTHADCMLKPKSITAAYHFAFYIIHTASNSCFRWLHVFCTIYTASDSCIGWLPQFLLPPHWIVETIGEDFLSVDFVSLTTPASITYQDISLRNNIHEDPPPPIWSSKFPCKDHCHLIFPDQYHLPTA